MREPNDMNLHHSINFILARRQSNAASNPCLRIAIHLLHLLLDLTPANLNGGSLEILYSIDESRQDLVNLHENTLKFRLPQVLHSADDIRELTTTKELCLCLQSSYSRHKL